MGDKDRRESEDYARIGLINEAQAVKSASTSKRSCGVHCGKVCDSWNEADNWHYDRQQAYSSDGFDLLA